MKIFAVKSTDIDATWPRVIPELERVLEHNWGFYSMDEIKNSLIAGDSLLLCVEDEDELLACIVCAEEPHPTKKVLHMPVVCGRRMKEWVGLCHETLPKLAKDRGYDMIITKGRRGWTKVLKAYGYEEMYVSLALDL